MLGKAVPASGIVAVDGLTATGALRLIVAVRFTLPVKWLMLVTQPQVV